MEIKNKHKGKVHPSPSPSHSTSPSPSPSPSPFAISSSPNSDALSVLNLLPAAILALASILSLQDREVLAYMITRSMKTTTNPSSAVNDSKKKLKKPSQTNNCNNNGGASHNPPLFYCDCFDCYTCYWFKWDSSPNRELIHQAIEAFEDHLSHGEHSKKINGRGMKKDKPSRRLSQKPTKTSEISSIKVETKISATFSPETTEDSGDVLPSEKDVSLVVSQEKAVGFEVMNKEEADVDEYPETSGDTEVVMGTAVAVQGTVANNHQHKGFGRKVIPDVLGLFISRLWNLWGPNV